MRKQLSVVPGPIRAHAWSPSELRSNPEEAFDLFDANSDGRISVPELLFTSRKTNDSVRKKGCLFEEMKLFQLLDVNQDSSITRAEFCAAVKTLDDANLAELSALANNCDEDDPEDDWDILLANAPDLFLTPKPTDSCSCTCPVS